MGADCVPFAMGDLHNRFLKDNSIAVGCPKLDDDEFYIEKLTAILKANKLNSLTVIYMEVPCCSGLTQIARQAISKNKIEMSFQDVILITIEFSRFLIMYLLILKTVTIGPARNYHTHWVYN